ncbi:DeoR/GlpR family DNA-binding transcription regulator [Pseudogracilibacillus sp. SE30717A]|uniref:DeoR/GlpR family DNA-binding transcription regulator n=1 Tax=Pseudogracilibacillus sp. SE30717A TaxID=3098293 RepID=UPI00300E4EB0
MLQQERHKKILEQLEKENTVRISELSKTLGVTRQTVRRDLKELDKVGLIKKVHGGALLNRTNIEPSFSTRDNTSVVEKDIIGKKAAEFVEDGDAIFIDLGTTTLSMARNLTTKKDLTVITNSLLIAMELANIKEIKVLISGGELRGEELSVSGPISNKSIQDIFIDKAFIGVGGLSLENGFTDFHLGECEFRRMMIKNAQKSIALADHSKVDIVAIYKFADIHEIDVLITDIRTPQNVVSHLRGKGMKVEVLDVK